MSNEQFATGAVRSGDVEHLRYDLISPIGLRRIAATCKEGQVKYSAFNWEKGMPIWSLLNHVVAHIFKYLFGDRSEDHLAHAAWGLLAAMHSEELWPELNEGTLRGPGGKPPIEKSIKTTSVKIAPQSKFDYVAQCSDLHGRDDTITIPTSMIRYVSQHPEGVTIEANLDPATCSKIAREFVEGAPGQPPIREEFRRHHAMRVFRGEPEPTRLADASQRLEERRRVERLMPRDASFSTHDRT